MVEKEDLRLGLSLRFPDEILNRSPLPQSNLMPSSSSSFSSSPPSITGLKASSWIDCFPSYLDRDWEPTRVVEKRSSLFKGIDVNRIQSSPKGDCEEEGGGLSSPNNSTISSLSGSKRSERDAVVNVSGGHDQLLEMDERTSSHGMISDDDDGDGSKKKLRLSKDQSSVLEDSFKEHNTLNPKQKLALAKRLGLKPRQVEVWFQNRRARTKLKQTEVDCEFLKRCCENLTDENRRLQKEVQELRALKLSSHQFYMQMTPPTTLTMCPSCERVGPPSSTSTAPVLVNHTRSHRLMTAAAHRRPQPPVAVFSPWAATGPIITQWMLDGLLQQRDHINVAHTRA